MKGRILKIKTGYNPNSSSIGLDMVAFLTAGAGVTVLFNAIAAILAARKGGKHAQLDAAKEASVLANQGKRG